MITINLAEALAGLNRLAQLNMRPWLAQVGRDQVAAIQHRIRVTKTDPDDQPWAPWRPYTRAMRIAKGNSGQGLLWDEGHLLASIKFYENADSVDIGTDDYKAKQLQEGRSNMAARPFIGWGEHTDLETSAIAFIEGLMR